jgi:hypothetical protein
MVYFVKDQFEFLVKVVSYRTMTRNIIFLIFAVPILCDILWKVVLYKRGWGSRFRWIVLNPFWLPYTNKPTKADRRNFLIQILIEILISTVFLYYIWRKFN